jgi:hypothetical protein
VIPNAEKVSACYEQVNGSDEKGGGEREEKEVAVEFLLSATAPARLR